MGYVAILVICVFAFIIGTGLYAMMFSKINQNAVDIKRSLYGMVRLYSWKTPIILGLIGIVAVVELLAYEVYYNIEVFNIIVLHFPVAFWIMMIESFALTGILFNTFAIYRESTKK